MTSESTATPWPPRLGSPAKAELAVAFRGFDDACCRLDQVITSAGHDPHDDDVLAVNVELSAALWFARSAVEELRSRSWSGMTKKLREEGHDAVCRDRGFLGVVNGFRWARNDAGHALARPGGYQPGLYPGPSTFPGTNTFPGESRWYWVSSEILTEAARRENDGRDDYDIELAGRELQPTLARMGEWLTQADALVIGV